MRTLFSFGNSKLPTSTMVFNMAPATECPADQLGLCANSSRCYAKRPEKDFREGVTLPKRRAQKAYWLSSSAEEICNDLDTILSRKRKLPTSFRFNEAGDFHSQDCITKLNTIADHLKNKYDIVTYGYTCRHDLDFSGATFTVLGSNETRPGYSGQFLTVVTKSGNNPVCPGSCKSCSLCQTYNGTIEVIAH